MFGGDFGQLGPVPGSSLSLSDTPDNAASPGADIPLNVAELSALAFQTATWREAKLVVVKLTRVYRQGEARELVMALQDVRSGLVNCCLKASLEVYELTQLMQNVIHVRCIQVVNQSQLSAHEIFVVCWNALSVYHCVFCVATFLAALHYIVRDSRG